MLAVLAGSAALDAQVLPERHCVAALQGRPEARGAQGMLGALGHAGIARLVWRAGSRGMLGVAP